MARGKIRAGYGKPVFCALILILVLGHLVAAQDSTSRPAPSVILPVDGFLPAWKKAEPVRRFSAENLYGYINGGAELFLEFGFRELLVQQYRERDYELGLEVYVMESSPAALGIYLMRCGSETPLTGITARSSGDRYQFTILKNNCFLLVNNFDGDSILLPAMTVLAQHALNSISEGDTVALFKYLPSDSLIAGSERLLRGPYGLQPIFTLGKGDILGLGGEIYATVGDYNSGNRQTYTQIIIPYPDTKSAAAVFANLTANLDPYLTILEQAEKMFIFQDFQKKFGSVQLQDSILTIQVHLPARPPMD